MKTGKRKKWEATTEMKVIYQRQRENNYDDNEKRSNDGIQNRNDETVK